MIERKRLERYERAHFLELRQLVDTNAIAAEHIAPLIENVDVQGCVDLVDEVGLARAVVADEAVATPAEEPTCHNSTSEGQP